MKSLLLNYSDSAGGAARAAYRIHSALRAAGTGSRMWVNIAGTGDWTVEGPRGRLGKWTARLRPYAGEFLGRLLQPGWREMGKGSTGLSLSILPSAWAGRINDSDADVINLHWMNGEMMSIRDVGRIRKPVVWTLHDMWAFCGAEHYADDLRWRDGYSHRSGGVFDVNRWTWQRKRRAWKRPVHIVTPSRWLGECVRDSALMEGWPVTVIPNTVNTDLWRPIDRQIARQILNLPTEVPLLLFGALGGTTDPRKGYDLLRSALQFLQGAVSPLQLVVFGQSAPRVPEAFEFPVHYAGTLHDDVALRLLYSAADLMVVPSRQESFGQTALEALACGTPVVAFASTGLLDIVRHQETGYLAKPFEAEDLAAGIQWVLSDAERYAKLSSNARNDAVERFSYPTVAAQYRRVYAAALEAYKGI